MHGMIDALRSRSAETPAKGPIAGDLESARASCGTQLADHTRFTLATDIRVYFCDPQTPWQRDFNENTNRLPRQYFPRGTD